MERRWDAERFARLCQRHDLAPRHFLLILLFARGHRERTAVGYLRDFVNGRGPAAQASGRARVPSS